MKEKYEPSTDFVLKVMKSVYAYEESKNPIIQWLSTHSSIRYAMMGIGALLGIFKTIPAF
ncbi:MAG: hypothetical protein JW927_18630 [Deltaproteobacteria bacterium]|nr:hypothetical protein [Deltaproteobacteria bacterium]